MSEDTHQFISKPLTSADRHEGAPGYVAPAIRVILYIIYANDAACGGRAALGAADASCFHRGPPPHPSKPAHPAALSGSHAGLSLPGSQLPATAFTRTLRVRLRRAGRTEAVELRAASCMVPGGCSVRDERNTGGECAASRALGVVWGTPSGNGSCSLNCLRDPFCRLRFSRMRRCTAKPSACRLSKLVEDLCPCYAGGAAGHPPTHSRSAPPGLKHPHFKIQ